MQSVFGALIAGGGAMAMMRSSGSFLSTFAGVGAVVCVLASGCEDAAAPPAPSTVALSADNLVVPYNSSATISGGVFTDDGVAISGPRLFWTSSNPGIAAVDQNGVVSGVWPGVATIYARAGTFVDSARVVVNTTYGIPGCGGYIYIDYPDHGFRYLTSYPAGVTNVGIVDGEFTFHGKRILYG